MDPCIHLLMNWPVLLKKLSARAHPAAVIAAALAILAGLYAVPRWLDQRYVE